MACFNCGSSKHNSASCDKPQQYTRCPSCRNVAQSIDGHKTWCSQKSFVSTFIGSTVLEVTNCLRIILADVSDVSIRDGLRDIPILNTPLGIAPLDIHVLMGSDGSLQFAESRSIDRILNVINKNDEPVLSFKFDDVSITDEN